MLSSRAVMVAGSGGVGFANDFADAVEARLVKGTTKGCGGCGGVDSGELQRLCGLTFAERGGCLHQPLGLVHAPDDIPEQAGAFGR
ncbi:MAG: hypothetical protein QM730_13005 [Anaerolineales bacterium]